MNRRVRLKIRLGMVGICLTVLALLVTVEELGTAPLNRTQDRLVVLQTQWAPATLALHELRAELAEMRAYELAQVSHGDDAAAVADYDKRIAASLERATQALADYEATNPPAQHAPRVQEVKQRLRAYLDAHARIEAAVHDGNHAKADQLAIAEAQPLRRALFDSIVALTEDTYRLPAAQPLAAR